MIFQYKNLVFQNLVIFFHQIGDKILSFHAVDY